MSAVSSGPEAGKDYPRNWNELRRSFPDEARCLAYLAKVRWGQGFKCPACGGGKAWTTKRGLYVCSSCQRQTSVLAGTIFQGTRTPLVTWFQTIWELTSQKNGKSALGLYQEMGFGSYGTAWAHLHKLRRAMVREDRAMLGGDLEVEVDETYVGGVEKGLGGRRVEKKAIVAIAVEVHTAHKGFGRVRLAVVDDVSGASLEDFVVQHIWPGSTVKTDAWAGYNRLPQLGYEHLVFNLSELSDPAHVVMPAVHMVASQLKRWLLGTLHGSVAMWQLPHYLEEFTFRYNRRHSRHRGLVFYRLIQQALNTAPTVTEKLYGS